MRLRGLGEHLLQGLAASREAAGERSDRHVHDLGSLLVGKALDEHQADREPLLLGQLEERVLDAEQLNLGARGRIANSLCGLLRRVQGLAYPAAATFVDPGVTQDAEKPAGEMRVHVELIGSGECPLHRDLHQIVRIVRIPRQSARESPQPRKNGDDLISKVLDRIAHGWHSYQTSDRLIFFHLRPEPKSGANLRFMLRAWLISLLLIPAAGAQIALPGLGGSPLPGGLPGLGLPAARQALPALTHRLDEDVHHLEDARRLQIMDLLHRYPRRIEADPNGNPIVRNEVLALNPDDAALARAGSAGFSVVRVRSLTSLGMRLFILRAPAGVSTAQALSELRRLDPAGTYDFDHIYTESGEVSEGSAGRGLRVGTQPGATNPAMLVSNKAVLGLIDGGVEVGHPVFQGASIHQHGCAGAQIPSAHGTAVASLLIGRAAQFTGAAPGAVLYAADVYCGRPAGGALDAVAAAFAWMVNEGVPVINVSLVGPPNALLQQVVDRVLAVGSLIVAAVGNDGPAAPPLYPADYPGVIGVTAVDAKRRVLFEAARGPQVMFAAPGADIDAARIPRGLAPVRGTSFAAPLVAGLLAQQLHRPDPRSATLAVQALVSRAIHLGPSGRNTVYGYGLVASDLPAHSSQTAAASD